MTDRRELIFWLQDLKEDDVAITEDGLTLVEVDIDGRQTDKYFEIGGLPDDVSEQDHGTCQKCGSDLEVASTRYVPGHTFDQVYCSDATCPYHDWPQFVGLNDLYDMGAAELETKYKVNKREEDHGV